MKFDNFKVDRIFTGFRKDRFPRVNLELEFLQGVLFFVVHQMNTVVNIPRSRIEGDKSLFEMS